MNDKFPHNDFVIKSLKGVYRGLREEDLSPLNPTYSCIICKSKCSYRKPKHSCMDMSVMTEEEFGLTYDFKE